MPDIDVLLKDGSVVKARVVGPQAADVGVGRKAARKLLDVAEAAGKVAAEIAQPIVSGSNADQVTIELGMAVAVAEGKLTALLVSGGVESSIKVTLVWNRQPDDRTPSERR
ncbi:MAG: CU044_2847 family protein [Ilumatobacteraceae bacterium]